MNPDEIRTLIRDEMRRELASLMRSDRFTFEKLIQLLDGRNIQVGRATGTEIATASDQKLGLWGTTPVIQPTAIADVGVVGTDTDGVCRTKVNDILAALRLPGFIDT